VTFAVARHAKVRTELRRADRAVSRSVTLLEPGKRTLTLRAPKTAPGGLYRLRALMTDPHAAGTWTASRAVRLPRAA
jgi:hypothetical protein